MSKVFRRSHFLHKKTKLTLCDNSPRGAVFRPVSSGKGKELGYFHSHRPNRYLRSLAILIPNALAASLRIIAKRKREREPVPMKRGRTISRAEPVRTCDTFFFFQGSFSMVLYYFTTWKQFNATHTCFPLKKNKEAYIRVSYLYTLFSLKPVCNLHDNSTEQIKRHQKFIVKELIMFARICSHRLDQ